MPRQEQPEYLSLFGSTPIRMTPISMHVLAENYMSAAKTLPDSQYQPARALLVCHAVELALKAFLSLKGQSAENLRKQFGHSLDELLREADAQGLSGVATLTQEERDEVFRASEYHRLRYCCYPALAEALRGYPGMPNVETMVLTAGKLVDSLREPCLQA